jgi:hypothetical protein
MDERTNQALVFVYNADSGLFNAATDMAHKLLSPRTYKCNLCALTYSTFGMREDWKDFLEALARPIEFLHADELKSLYSISNVQLPAVFKKDSDQLELLINADSINGCLTIADLKRLLTDKLKKL